MVSVVATRSILAPNMIKTRSFGTDQNLDWSPLYFITLECLETPGSLPPNILMPPLRPLSVPPPRLYLGLTPTISLDNTRINRALH